MKKISSRDRRVAELIRDREPFQTYGSFYGEAVTPGTHQSSGWLNNEERTRLFSETDIDYIVWSFYTPIAWHRTDGTWYRVSQRFTVTTSKHQGKLYLIPSADHEAFLSPVSHQSGSRWRLECDTCGTVISLHEYKKDAREAEHDHRINGIPPVGF